MPSPLRHASPLALPGVTVVEREIDLLIAAMASRGAAAECPRAARGGERHCTRRARSPPLRYHVATVASGI